ncbi:hypothetical protein [bacterium endosymbiont of Pedicinus badii]
MSREELNMIKEGEKYYIFQK